MVTLWRVFASSFTFVTFVYGCFSKTNTFEGPLVGLLEGSLWMGQSMSASLGEASTCICCRTGFLVLLPSCCFLSRLRTPWCFEYCLWKRRSPTHVHGTIWGRGLGNKSRVLQFNNVNIPEEPCPEVPDTLVSLKQWYEVSKYIWRSLSPKIMESVWRASAWLTNPGYRSNHGSSPSLMRLLFYRNHVFVERISFFSFFVCSEQKWTPVLLRFKSIERPLIFPWTAAQWHKQWTWFSKASSLVLTACKCSFLAYIS